MNDLPEPQAPLRVSYKGDSCWVCGQYFIDHPKGTDPSVVRNCHHVVPRAYGGLNGPTVMLCSAHHDILHAIACAMSAGAPDRAQSLCGDLTLEPRARLLYLSNVVHQAEKATANDPNKRGQLSLVLSPSTRRELEKLCSLYSMSQARFVEGLIRAQYRKDFPLANE